MDLIFEATFVGRSHRSKDSCSLQVFYSPKEKKLAFEKLFDNRQSSNQEFDFIKEKDVVKKIIDEVLVIGREFIMKDISIDEYKIEKRIPEKVFTERKLKENSLLFGFDVAGNEWVKVYIDNDAFWISNDMYDDRTHFQQMFDYRDTTLEKCFDRATGSPEVLHIGQVRNNTVKEHLSNWLRFGEKKYPVAGKELTREVIIERVKKVTKAKNNFEETTDKNTTKMRKELFDLCFDYFEFDYSGYMTPYEEKNLPKIEKKIKDTIKRYINLIDYEIKGNNRTSGSPLYVLDSLANSIMNIGEIFHNERISIKTKRMSSGLFSDDKQISNLANDLYDYTMEKSRVQEAYLKKVSEAKNNGLDFMIDFYENNDFVGSMDSNTFMKQYGHRTEFLEDAVERYNKENSNMRAKIRIQGKNKKSITRNIFSENTRSIPSISNKQKEKFLYSIKESKYGKQNTLFGDPEEVFYDTNKLYKEIVRYVESRFNIDILKRELKVNIKDLAEHIYDWYLDYLSENPRSKKENINSLLDSLIDEELFEEYALQRYFSIVIDLIENKVEKEIDEDNLLSQFKDNFPKNEVFRNMDIERNNDKETINYLVKDIGINISDLEKYILKTKPNLIYSMTNIVYSSEERGSYNLISFFENYDYIDLGESLTDALEKADTYFPDMYTTIERELSSIGSFEKNKVMKVYLDIDYAVSIDNTVIDEYLESRRA